jgi:molybdopterin adenylyltransferase
MKPHEKHRSEGPDRLTFNVVTISSSRFQRSREGKRVEDEGGDLCCSEIEAAHHAVAGRSLISDSPPAIRRELRTFLSGGADVIVLTGGTGVAKRDVTIETARPFFEKELDGFGELLRRLSYDEVGAAAILTRATAGVAKGKVILCLPGSPGAVRTGLRSILRELPHVLYVARL